MGSAAGHLWLTFQSKILVYHYFPTKEALFEEIIAAAAEGALRLTREVALGSPAARGRCW